MGNWYESYFGHKPHTKVLNIAEVDISINTYQILNYPIWNLTQKYRYQPKAQRKIGFSWEPLKKHLKGCGNYWKIKRKSKIKESIVNSEETRKRRANTC